MGALRMSMNNFAEAETLFADAVDIARRTLPTGTGIYGRFAQTATSPRKPEPTGQKTDA